MLPVQHIARTLHARLPSPSAIPYRCRKRLYNGDMRAAFSPSCARRILAMPRTKNKRPNMWHERTLGHGRFITRVVL